MGQLIWRTVIKFKSGTLHGAASLLFDCDSINMTFGMVVCIQIIDPPASQIVPPDPQARREAAEGEEEEDSDSDEDGTPLEQRQWASLQEYRHAVIDGLRYRLVSSADCDELAGMRMYVKEDRVACVFWAHPDQQTWNALKGRIFLLLVGPSDVSSTDKHIVMRKSDCRTYGHVMLERELLGYCQNVVEDKWGMKVLVHRRPEMVMSRDQPPQDVEKYYGRQPAFIPAAFYFPSVVHVPWPQD